MFGALDIEGDSSDSGDGAPAAAPAQPVAQPAARHTALPKKDAPRLRARQRLLRRVPRRLLPHAPHDRMWVPKLRWVAHIALHDQHQALDPRSKVPATASRASLRGEPSARSARLRTRYPTLHPGRRRKQGGAGARGSPLPAELEQYRPALKFLLVDGQAHMARMRVTHGTTLTAPVAYVTSRESDGRSCSYLTSATGSSSQANSTRLSRGCSTMQTSNFSPGVPRGRRRKAPVHTSHHSASPGATSCTCSSLACRREYCPAPRFSAQLHSVRSGARKRPPAKHL